MPLEWEQLDRLTDHTGTDVDIPPFCLNCGYNLIGAVSSRCPECGTHFDAHEWRRLATVLKRQRQEFEEAATWVKLGCKAAGIALAVVILGMVIRPGWGMFFFRAVGVLGGFAALFLGLNRVRVGQAPKGVPAGLFPSGDMMLAVASILLGLAAGVGAILAPM